ncbi:M56 family metallopeptidase [Croceiramulus getboli]|nr:M56 family metallopeptidase [Flavobacteriaceae bacterium YJPT1-3]
MIWVYLIKSTLCMLLFLGFYKLALEPITLHHFKRFYLLASLVAALLFPTITFYETVVVDPATLDAAPYQIQVPTTESMSQQALFSWNKVALLLYLIGVALFSWRLLKNLHQLYLKIKTSEQIPQKEFNLALIRQDVSPHSFLRWILLSRKQYYARQIPKEILQHEATHIRQRHSIDLLLIELLRVVFWFNPLLWWYKSSIQLNHEFLADQGVIQHQKESINYQFLLLDYLNGTHHASPQSAINYSLTKKRMLMLSKHPHKRKGLIALLAIPLFALSLFGFSKKESKLVLKENAISSLPAVGIPTQDMTVKATNKQPLIKEHLVQDSRITIQVRGSKLRINGQAVDPSAFAEKLDELTADYSQGALANTSLRLQLQDADEDFLNKLEREYRKTQLYKNDPEKRGLIPPPPPAPPVPQQVALVELPSAPKTPPAPQRIAAPSAPNAPKEPVVIEVLDVPKAPPAPEEVDMEGDIKALADEGAEFYINGKKVSSRKALKAVQNEMRKIKSVCTNRQQQIPRVDIQVKE